MTEFFRHTVAVPNGLFLSIAFLIGGVGSWLLDRAYRRGWDKSREVLLMQLDNGANYLSVGGKIVLIKDKYVESKLPGGSRLIRLVDPKHV